MVLLYNFVLAAMTLDLMLANMTKRHFSITSLPLVFCAAPLFTHFVFKCSADFNSYFFIAMLAFSALYFYARMAIVCK